MNDKQQVRMYANTSQERVRDKFAQRPATGCYGSPAVMWRQADFGSAELIDAAGRRRTNDGGIASVRRMKMLLFS